MKDTYNADFDLLESRENIELGQANVGEAVDGIAVTQLRNIEPAAATRTTSRGSEFVSSLRTKRKVSHVYQPQPGPQELLGQF
jgi:hypothetical protein